MQEISDIICVVYADNLDLDIMALDNDTDGPIANGSASKNGDHDSEAQVSDLLKYSRLLFDSVCIISPPNKIFSWFIHYLSV